VSQVEPSQESPGDTGPARGRRSPERPETPTEHESLASSEYVTPEKVLPTRDVTHAPWGVDDGWTPQSLRTQTTISSPPTSPPHPFSALKHKAVTRSDAATESPSRSSQQPAEHDVPGDDTETKTPVSLMAPWRGRESPEPGPADNRQSTASEGNTGSLFRRMRSIFEQPRPSISSTRDSHQPSPTRSRPPSVTWFPAAYQAADVHSPTQKRFSPLPSPSIASDHHHQDSERNSLLPHGN
jgi:hypothetical protein